MASNIKKNRHTKYCIYLSCLSKHFPPNSLVPPICHEALSGQAQAMHIHLHKQGMKSHCGSPTSQCLGFTSIQESFSRSKFHWLVCVYVKNEYALWIEIRFNLHLLDSQASHRPWKKVIQTNTQSFDYFYIILQNYLSFFIVSTLLYFYLDQQFNLIHYTCLSEIHICTGLHSDVYLKQLLMIFSSYGMSMYYSSISPWSLISFSGSITWLA